MTSRERVGRILARTNEGKPGFWTGNPHPDTLPLYLEELRLPDAEALYAHFGDDVRWIPADLGFRHPEGKPVFDFYGGREREHLNMPGVFADCDSVAEVEAFAWPNLDYLDFSATISHIERHSTRSVWTGLWSPFFHDIAEFFGMDNYFMGMYERPAVVEAVTNGVVTYYEQANERFFAELGGRADVFFFGNDFGTQRSLMLSPELFERFVLPSMRRLIAVAKRHGKRVVLHSCGAISQVMPSLIDAGVDAFHPLQALAEGMQADHLAREFGHDVAFVGGVDTQWLLVEGSPEEVREEVLRLRGVFGPNYIVSPSHEALLPNVVLDNVAAMASAARE